MESSASFSSTLTFHALIAAAGSGERLGGDTPKQYRKIKGKTVLRHTLEAFLACPGLREMRVIINPAHQDLYEESVEGLDLPWPIHGGETRNQSIYNGVKAFFNLKDQEKILIHDAARPFIKPAEIQAVAMALNHDPAVTLATPVADTLRRDDGTYVDRGGLWSVQTPQGFRYGLIARAHEQAGGARNATDDTALVAALGEDIKIVEGRRENFKITTAQDWDMAQKLFGGSGAPRTGFGFDVHAFDPLKPGPVRLCGVDIGHDKALLGHSDADAGLHALTDALLGAIAAGDIGQHFPPSDMRWKGADSAVFLKHAMDMVRERGGTVSNVDITIICEAPKIGPHRAAMQARIAAICGLSPEQVGIKATTSEGLGFTGRGEGIAAQAVATVLL